MGSAMRCTGYDRRNAEIVRAMGSTLYTVDGREMVDLESGVWAAILGHNHPRINAALSKQLNRIGHIGYCVSSSIQDQAAEALLAVTGLSGGQCIFLSSGSEAVEFGAQAARRVTGRPLLLALPNTFLGSYGTVGNREADEWTVFDWTGCNDCPPEQVCTDACPRMREIPFDRMGGFVFEAGSVHICLPPAKAMIGLRDAIRSHGGWIIANEVTTGMGRTGRLFGYEHFDLDPDIVVVGKGLGNGYPVSAVAFREGLADKLLSTGFRYAQSHQNDPMACTIALEVLRTLQDEKLIERSAAVGAAFLGELERLASVHAPILEARGYGLMTAIMLDEGKPCPRTKLLDGLYQRGFLAGYKLAPSYVRFFPPLTTPQETLERLVVAIDESLS